MEKHTFTKEYQLWIGQGHGNYSVFEYDTIDECICNAKYTDEWYITKRVKFEVFEYHNDR